MTSSEKEFSLLRKSRFTEMKRDSHKVAQLLFYVIVIEIRFYG